MRVRVSDQRGFSMPELLVAIAIIVVLIALLFPVVVRARSVSRSVRCLGTVAQWGHAFQMYQSATGGMSIAEPSNSVTAARWWEVIEPYAGNSRLLLLCPDATTARDGVVPPAAGSTPRSASGSASHAWMCPTYSSGSPQYAIRGNFVGSYGFNSWLFHRQRPGNASFVRFPPKGADRVPLIGDCADPWPLVSWTDRPPGNIQDPDPRQVGELSSFCLDRHRRAVNIVFVDGHAEHVQLAELWNLKWSGQFIPRTVVVP